MQNARLAAGGTLSEGLLRWAFSVHVRQYYTRLKGFVQEDFHEDFSSNQQKLAYGAGEKRTIAVFWIMFVFAVWV